MQGRSAAARAAAAGGAVVALVLLASLAGRHPAWSTGVGRRSLVSGAGHAFTVVLLVVAVAFVVAYVRLARQRRQRLTRADLRAMLALLIALFVVLLLARGLHHGGSGGGPGHPLPTSSPHGGGGSHAVHWSDARWLLVLPLLGLLALAAASFALARRRRAPAPEVAEPVAEAVVAVLDEALDDLGDEGDPRRAVIAAYAQMEAALGRAGLPRVPSEAPREYLRRVLPTIGAGAESVEHLTGLFERAKFSPHAIDAAMKEEAISALETLRDELRGAS